MKKTGYLILFAVMAFAAFAYALESNGFEQSPEIKGFEDEGFKFTGSNSADIKYNDGTIVMPDDKAVIQIPENFNRDIKVERGTVVVPKSFGGKVEVKDATIIDSEGNAFHGSGSYSKSKGFAIKEGNLNELLISNGHNINYRLEDQTFTGTTDSSCKDESGSYICQIAGQKIGAETDFIYNEREKKITLIGKPGKTTIQEPSFNIIKYKEAGSENLATGVTLGEDMQLDTKNSRIFLAPGESLPKESKWIKVEGIADRLEAKDKETQITFEPYENGIKIKPVIYKDEKFGAAVNKPDADWNDAPLPKAKDLNVDDTVYIRGKIFDATIDYDPKKEIGDDSKKYYITYKDIEVVDMNLKNNPEFSSFIKQKSLESELPEEFLIAMCAAESLCNPKEKCNSVGACGAFSVMYISVKDTIKREQGYTDNDDEELIRAARAEFEKTKYDQQKNTDFGAKYAEHLVKICGGNIQCALASYNAGPTRILKLGEIPENGETPQYIRRFLAFYSHYKSKKVI